MPQIANWGHTWPDRWGSTPPLRLTDELACHRNDPQQRRLELLNALIFILPAAAAAACVVKIGPGLKSPQLVSVVDAGFKAESQREAFLNEFEQVPFQDPLSYKGIEAARGGSEEIFTAARRTLVDDETWYSSPNVKDFRRAADIDDCLFSATRRREVRDGEELHVICVFRSWGDPMRFSSHHRVLLDTLHAGLDWMDQKAEAKRHVERVAALSPRLRKTLDLLLAGNTEQAVADKMSISVHTVHEYVGILLAHFNASSRVQLMAQWIQQ